MSQSCFEISVNRVHKAIFGHRHGCTQARKHAGGKTGIQEHDEGYESSEEIELAADQIQAMDSEFAFDWCSFCCEDLKLASTHI